MKEIKRIASKVRHWAKNRDDCYQDLWGWCGVCSVKIFKELQKIGKNPEFVMIKKEHVRSSHCIVICDGYIIDVTATQFGNDRAVNVIPVVHIDSGKYNFWYWDYQSAFFIGSDINIIKTKFKSWSDRQNPFIGKGLEKDCK